jgi:hypothetical protein
LYKGTPEKEDFCNDRFEAMSQISGENVGTSPTPPNKAEIVHNISESGDVKVPEQK